jgi:uncharacterized membrane protein
MAIGPVQILIVGFDHPEFKGDVLAELRRLRESDVVRLIDLVVVRKDEDGNVERFKHTDLTTDELQEFGATIGALIGLGLGGDEETMAAGAVLGAEAMANPDDNGDGWFVDDAIPPGSAAAIALIEHRWAIPLREAIQATHGFHLADAWIHPSDLVAIGMLAAEEAAVGA